MLIVKLIYLLGMGITMQHSKGILAFRLFILGSTISAYWLSIFLKLFQVKIDNVRGSIFLHIAVYLSVVIISFDWLYRYKDGKKKKWAIVHFIYTLMIAVGYVE
jgi:hypothetical protein